MIYFLHAPEAGRIKIGYSKDCDRRVGDFTVGCPVELNLLTTAEGSQQDEHALHRTFRDLRRRGEWFEASPSLLAFCRILASVPENARRALIHQRIGTARFEREANKRMWDSASEIKSLRECTAAFIAKHGKAKARELTGAARKTVDLWSNGQTSISAMPMFKLATFDSKPFEPFLGARIERLEIA